MPRKKTVKRICELCDQTFLADSREVNRGNARFCSRGCAAKHRNSCRPLQVHDPNCKCGLCGADFYRKPSAQRGGLYCSPECFYKATHPLYTRDQLIQIIRAFHRAEGRIPVNKDFGSNPTLPPPSTYRDVFGTWNNAIEAAGLTPNSGSFGMRVLAKDGHECRSSAEKTIDDWLFDHGIPHDKEVYYPFSRLRADWRIFDAYVEYFGMDNGYDHPINKAYRETIELKRSICLEWGIDLIEVFPEMVHDFCIISG